MSVWLWGRRALLENLIKNNNLLTSDTFDKKHIRTRQGSDPPLKCLSLLGDQLPHGSPRICLQKKTLHLLAVLDDHRGGQERDNSTQPSETEHHPWFL